MENNGYLVVIKVGDKERKNYVFPDSESARRWAKQTVFWRGVAGKQDAIIEVLPLDGGDLVKTCNRYRELLDNVIERTSERNDKNGMFHELEGMGFVYEDFFHFGFNKKDIDNHFG